MDRETQEAKLSARIIAIAAPCIQRIGPNPTLPALQFVYHICEMVWNVSRLEDATAREAMVGELRDRVVSVAPTGTKIEVRQFFDLMYERALAAWPEDRRFVARLTVVDVGGGSYRVDVVSVTGHDGRTPISPEPPQFHLRRQ